MCVIIIKDSSDKDVSKDILAKSAAINPHGLGIVWLDTYEITYHKSKDWRELMTDRPYIAHFRLATVGKVCKSNVHPFKCGNNPNESEYLMQNGTVKGYGNKNMTDTEDLANKLSTIKRAHWKRHLAKFDCRFVTINTKHKSYQIYNKDDWHKYNGVWYSKANVLPYYVAVYGTLKEGYSNHRLMQDADFINSGVTKSKYPLIVDGLPYMFDKKGVGHNVKVEVYDCDHITMHRLDVLEGHPTFYCRKRIPITLDCGDEIVAWVYFINGTFNRSIDECVESYTGRSLTRPVHRNYGYSDFYIGSPSDDNYDGFFEEEQMDDAGLIIEDIRDDIHSIDEMIEDAKRRVTTLTEELKRLAMNSRGTNLRWADDNICPECGTHCVVDEFEGLAYCAPCDAMYHADVDFNIS